MVTRDEMAFAFTLMECYPRFLTILFIIIYLSVCVVCFFFSFFFLESCQTPKTLNTRQRMAPQSHVTGHIFLDAANTNDRSKQREKKSEIEAACRRQFQHLKREFFFLSFFLPSVLFFIKCVLFLFP